MSASTSLDLATVGAGFSDEGRGSQAVFRAVMKALSQPAQWVAVTHDAQVPAGVHGAAAATALALVDADCSIALSPRVAASGAGDWLRFHTGVQVLSDAAQADFVWVGQADSTPDLAGLRWGKDDWPEHGATLLLECADAPDRAAWLASGPGLAAPCLLSASRLDAMWLKQWQTIRGAFPRGVDVLLTRPDAVLGLPRTTTLAAQES